MNTSDQFPAEQRIDRLLSAFFKAELPDPFPTMKAPAADMPMPAVAAAAREHRSSLQQSRLSLAASVALLLGGCWYLSGQITAPTERPSMGTGDGSAKLIKELRKADAEPKKPPMP